MNLTGYLAIACLALVIALGLAGWGLKHQIEVSATLKREVVEHAQSIKRLSDQAAEQERERQKLDAIIQQRDSERRSNEQRAVGAKAILRVVASDKTDFSRCLPIHWPDSLAQRLRSSSGGEGNSQTIPSSTPDG